jgi:hypothetical protein
VGLVSDKQVGRNSCNGSNGSGRDSHIQSRNLTV